MGSSDIIRKLEDLRGRYRESLPRRLGEIQRCWEAFVQSREHEQGGDLEQLYQLLHSLAGSAETFGLPGISGCARRCLDQLRPIYNGEQTSLAPQSLRICEDSLEEILDSLWYCDTQREAPQQLSQNGGDAARFQSHPSSNGNSDA